MKYSKFISNKNLLNIFVQKGKLIKFIINSEIEIKLSNKFGTLKIVALRNHYSIYKARIGSQILLIFTTVSTDQKMNSWMDWFHKYYFNIYYLLPQYYS